jgi:hypothetical protein
MIAGYASHMTKVKTLAIWFVFGVGLFVFLLTGNPLLLRLWAAVGVVLAAAMYARYRARVSRLKQERSVSKRDDAARSIEHHGRSGRSPGELIADELTEARTLIQEADERSQGPLFNASIVAEVAALNRRLREFSNRGEPADVLVRARTLRSDAEHALIRIRGRR